MSSLPGNFDLLVDWFPREGFRWQRGKGSPRLLRSDARDDVVRRAIIDLLGDGGKFRKREAQSVLADSVASTAKIIKDGEHGIRPEEDIIDFLERSAQLSDLSKEVPGDVWVELIFQTANARYKYERETPEAQKRGDADQLPALAFAIDALVNAAGTQWDWMSLEMYSFPHLMGEAADYEIDEEEDEEEEDDEETSLAGIGGEGMEDVEMGGEDARAKIEADTELPRHMANLSVMDTDEDVDMAI